MGYSWEMEEEMITLEKLQEIESAAKEATDGEWINSNATVLVIDSLPPHEFIAECFIGDTLSLVQGNKNANYIVTAQPTTVLELVRVIRKMREGLNRISETKVYTESESTGTKFYHSTEGAFIAISCLKDCFGEDGK